MRGVGVKVMENEIVNFLRCTLNLRAFSLDCLFPFLRYRDGTNLEPTWLRSFSIVTSEDMIL